MQQRYYEPLAGRFLSVDPVTTDAKMGGHFNRYVYGNNNPYKFIDPDGREPHPAIDRLFPRGDIFRAAGESFGALAAYVQGAVTGNEVLKAVAIDGMRENVTKGDAVNAASMLLGGRAGEAGSKPLLGQNPTVGGARTNTGLPGDRATAKSIFRHETKGQMVTEGKTANGQGILRQSEDGTKIRMNADSTTRLDLPGRGPLPNGETLHIPPKDK